MDLIQRERPLVELSQQIAEIRLSLQKLNLTPERQQEIKTAKKQMAELEAKFESLAQELSSNLDAYQIVQLSRHPNRPYPLDIINQLCTDFIELHGDRNFLDDPAIVAGIATFRNRSLVIIGQQKGRSTKENVKRNFGMPRPEGYRKALRVMSLAERLKMPIVTFIDTPGAYPGIEAEERGQSEAIAKNIMVMSRLAVPIVTVVVGEGGSGGALAIGVANRVFMLEYSTYSVITPEGCASILWKDGSKANKAAQILGLTADVALKNKIIDGIIKEPAGGAHWNPRQAINSIGETLEKSLNELSLLSPAQLKQDRAQKFSEMGQVKNMPPLSPLGAETPPIAAWSEPWEDICAALKLTVDQSPQKTS